MIDIELLLPQRYPFLFVDDILSADNDEIIGLKMYDKSFLFSQGYFPGNKIIPGVILIESMVQCGGAGVTQMGRFGKALWGLAAIENVRFYGIVELGATVKMIVKNLKVSGNALKQSGAAYVNGKIIAEATWLCLRLKA